MYVFYVSGKIPLEFKVGKEYNVGTGYIALAESDNDSVLLCRFEQNDNQNCISRTAFQESSHYVVNEKGEKRNVIVLCEMEDMSQADKRIQDYKKALDHIFCNKLDPLEKSNEKEKYIIP